MRRMILILLVFVAIGVMIRTMNPADDMTRNIPYGEDRRQVLDLFLPTNNTTDAAAPYPVLMFVSGGGWTQGSKDWVGHVAQTFAAEGIGVVTVDHRLLPDVDYADQVNDLAQAFLWIKDNIADHGGDPSRIIIGGHSAGAHLITLLSVDDRFLNEIDLAPSDIAGVIAVSGIMEIDQILTEASGLILESDIAREEASPISYVNADLPPMLILVAEDDNPHLKRQSAHMFDELRAAGIQTHYEVIAERDHFNIITRISPADTGAKPVMLRWMQAIFTPA